MNDWNPIQYERFSAERLRPALELLARIPLVSPRVVCDLGCGTGEVTRRLAERWRSAEVYGLDHSREMLEAARATPDGSIHWIEGDLADWTPTERPDVIYSNAALHWVERHEELLPRLVRSLAPGGCLAVQMPLSWELPSHRLMREVLANGGEGGRPLGSDELRRRMARKWVGDPDDYYDLLAEMAPILDIWETRYFHVLTGDDPVLEWVKGTGLRPILHALGADERSLFLNGYRRRLREAYPPQADGRTLYPFGRLFIVAQSAS